ncbi:hypothetical protein ACFL21_03830 [Patescibacteria group bacterium]
MTDKIKIPGIGREEDVEKPEDRVEDEGDEGLGENLRITPKINGIVSKTKKALEDVLK